MWPGGSNVASRSRGAFAWTISTLSDYRIEGVEGTPPPPELDASGEFFQRFEALASTDPDLWIRLQETVHMVRDPAWIQSEEILRRVTCDWDRLGRLAGIGR